jgi:cytochrome P450
MAARARIDEWVYAEIARVRTRSTADDHVLTMLVNGRDEEGQALSDAEIRDQVVSLIAAGYETTSAAMAWAIYALLSIPGMWDTASREVQHTLDGRMPDPADLKALTYLNGVVHETLRLYPPGVISARKVMRELWFDGHRIRAGRMLIFSPYVTHRLPELWPDPLRFRPERWDPASPHYRKPAPQEFLPFSGGTHRCIGSVFATTEMTVMLARLLARTSLRLPAQRVRASGYAALRPRHGLRVDITEQPVRSQLSTGF